MMTRILIFESDLPAALCPTGNRARHRRCNHRHPKATHEGGGTLVLLGLLLWTWYEMLKHRFLLKIHITSIQYLEPLQWQNSTLNSWEISELTLGSDPSVVRGNGAAPWGLALILFLADFWYKFWQIISSTQWIESFPQRWRSDRQTARKYWTNEHEPPWPVEFVWYFAPWQLILVRLQLQLWNKELAEVQRMHFSNPYIIDTSWEND